MKRERERDRRRESKEVRVAKMKWGKEGHKRRPTKTDI